MVRLSCTSYCYIILCIEENEKLKAEVSAKDMIIAKMMKEKSEPKEELATDTKCIQCDYWTKTGITDLS